MSHQQEKEQPTADMDLQQVGSKTRRASPFTKVSPSDLMGENEALQQASLAF